MSPVRGSRYTIIWVKLKAGEEVKLSVPKEYHLKLKKAIVRRKNKDWGFKLLMSEANRRHLLSFKSEGNILTVKLHTPALSTWL